MTTLEQMSAYSARTEERLRQLLDGLGISALLKESMAYSLFAGGKRLRPALCMAACALVGGREEDALDAACAMEMIHTYSLIHDDLPCMDNDGMRRGKPSNHVAFGEANALLAGDGLLSLAFLVSAQCGNTAAARDISAGALDMVTGQSYDLTASEDPAMLETIHRLKTGALIKASVLAGADCGGARPEERTALERFAEQYGMLFQITDDILDVEGDAAVLGKNTGKDAAEHKLTYVTRFGLEGARERALETAGAARESLAAFGGKADFFIGLVDYTIARKK